jgi:hypothetical protein
MRLRLLVTGYCDRLHDRGAVHREHLVVTAQEVGTRPFISEGS